MKLTEFYQGEAADPSLRKRRLQMLLSAWRFPRFACWAERAVPPPSTALTPQELPLWFEILRAALPIPPRTHAAGLETYARLHGICVADLVNDHTVLIVHDRVALRSQFTGLGQLRHGWSLLVPAQIGWQATEAVLRKRFRQVEAHDDEVIAWGSSGFDCTDSIAVLVCEALMADTRRGARPHVEAVPRARTGIPLSVRVARRPNEGAG